MRREVMRGLLALVLAGLAPAQEADTLREYLGRQLEAVAGADGQAAEDAAAALRRRAFGPLSQALDGLTLDGALERLRVREAVDAAVADLRADAFRAGLTADERALFDSFRGEYGELVRSVFAIDRAARRDALDRIPRAPGSGAGLLVAALAQDDDLETIEAALRVARDFRDPVLHAALRRLLGDILAVLESERVSADPAAYALMYGRIACHTAIALCESGGRDALPEIEAVLLRFGGSEYADYLELGNVLDALGRLGAEPAAPLLVRFLDQPRLRYTRAVGAGVLLTQTLGDAALLALLEIYGIEPAALGFVTPGDASQQYGFTGATDRLAAVGRFRAWYAENADRPAAERTALTPATSQPIGP